MTESPALTLLGPLFASDAMTAVFNDRARLQAMLDFEAALAHAGAAAGLLPAAAAGSITSACKADLFDIAALARDTAEAGNPAIPMVKQLTAVVARQDAAGARFVDVTTPMLAPNGRPNRKLFLFDGIHPSPAGYAVWTATLKPRLEADLGAP